MTDGVMRASARASALATAVRFKNALAVMPDDTCANPLVGSDAGQPITKLAALNGVCWPTRISPALLQLVDDAVDVVVVDRDLEVLGRVPVGDRDRLVERTDEHASPVGAERRPGGRGPDVGQIGELRHELGVRRVGEVGRRGDRARPTNRCRARLR